jgi:hypothetical protein
MNCRPGDMAVIVNGGQFHSEHEGKIVQVLHLLSPTADGPLWAYQPPLMSSKFRVVIPGVEDIVLRPIRDPGDDATDETLAWKPVPVETPIAA